MTCVTYFPLRRGLWVGMARKACWLMYCKIPPDVVEHPGTSGILHFSYYILGQIKSLSGVLNSEVVWVLNTGCVSSSVDCFGVLHCRRALCLFHWLCVFAGKPWQWLARARAPPWVTTPKSGSPWPKWPWRTFTVISSPSTRRERWGRVAAQRLSAPFSLHSDLWWPHLNNSHWFIVKMKYHDYFCF